MKRFPVFLVCVFVLFGCASREPIADLTVRQANLDAEYALYEAHLAASKFFLRHPDQTITYADLVAFGFQGKDGVTIAITRPTMDAFQMYAEHAIGDKRFEIDLNRNVTTLPKPGATPK